MSGAILELRDLVTGYGRPPRGRRVAGPLSALLRTGRMTALLGCNGAGKSTLLRTLARLQPPLSGRILLEEAPLEGLEEEELARIRAMVLPDREAPPGMPARDLVALGRHPRTNRWGSLSAADREAIDGALEALDIPHLADRPMGELSDGERQRVFIARALAQEPRLLLLDEPTAFLDLPHRVEVIRLLRSLCRTRGTTVLAALHDVPAALRWADRLWLLDREGNLFEGTPEDLILSGRLGDLFSLPDLRFDPLRGIHEALDEPLRGTIRLEGTGRARECASLLLRRQSLREIPEEGDAPSAPRLLATGEDARTASFRLETRPRAERPETGPSAETLADLEGLEERLARLFPDEGERAGRDRSGREGP